MPHPGAVFGLEVRTYPGEAGAAVTPKPLCEGSRVTP